MALKYNVFISHSWTYTSELENLQNLLESRGYFHVEFQHATKDVPINSENAAYIKQRLKTMISKSDVVLAIAGIYATYSDWMAWELSISKMSKKTIIGVIPWGQQRISALVNKNAIEVVGWNTESIVAAIRRHV